jgi:hypothetical protein
MAVDLLAWFTDCMNEAKQQGDMGAAAVLEAVRANPARRRVAIQTLTDGSTFFKALCRHLKPDGSGDVAFYTAACIGPQTWHHMHDPDYQPSRNTVFRAVLALKLDYLDAAILMEKAGYTFRCNDRLDMAVTCLLRKGVYDRTTVDGLLHENGLPTLFS